MVAALFARSLRRGLDLDLGFETDGVVVATINLAPHDYDEARGRAFFTRLLEQLRAQPGVEEAGLSEFVFLMGEHMRSDIQTPDSVAGGMTRLNARFDWVDERFFDVLGLDIVRGRGIEASDDEAGRPVVVVNETLARRLWPGESPLGRRIRGYGEDREVVGVVRDGRYTFIQQPPVPFLFFPFRQFYRASMAVYVRAPGAEAGTLRALEAEVRRLDPNIALEGAARLSSRADFSLFPHRFAAALVGVFGLVGLILAAVGIYGVLAFQVAQRTREFGVRRALGARPRDVTRQVLREGATLVAVGCAFGVAFGAAIAVLMRSLLIGLGPLDPPTFLGVPLALFAVGVLASWLPARRAVAVEPTDAIRST